MNIKTTIDQSKLIVLMLSLLALSVVQAGEVTSAFDNNSILTGAQMREIKAAVNDNNARMAALEFALATLQADLKAANGLIATLQSDLVTANGAITTLESNSVLDLDGNLIFVLDANGNPTAQFTGVNVQVINGVSQATRNGLGNLIVGYNANTSQGADVCSDGSFVDQASCETAGNIWALNHKTGSHNLVGGNNNSYSNVGGLVFGQQNKINRGFASVTGGNRNNASGSWSSVSGGYGNKASGDRSHVGGGFGNEAGGLISNVSGGEQNNALGQMSSVLGGFANTVQVNTGPSTGKWNAILGGQFQSISGVNSTTIPALP